MTTIQPTPRTRPRLPSGRLLLALYAPPLALLATVSLAAREMGIEVEAFLRDPAHLEHFPIYTGIVSNLGITVWCAGGAIALFGARSLTKARAHDEQRRFLFWSGLLTLYLMLDDLVMLHDDVYPNLFHVYEQVVFLAYLPIAVIYVARFRRQLFGAYGFFVALTAVFAAVSLTMDQWHMLLTVFGRLILPENQLIEKGAKLLAMVSWTAFLAQAASDAVTQRDPEISGSPTAAGIR